MVLETFKLRDLRSCGLRWVGEGVRVKVQQCISSTIQHIWSDVSFCVCIMPYLVILLNLLGHGYQIKLVAILEKERKLKHSQNEWRQTLTENLVDLFTLMMASQVLYQYATIGNSVLSCTCISKTCLPLFRKVLTCHSVFGYKGYALWSIFWISTNSDQRDLLIFLSNQIFWSSIC